MGSRPKKNGAHDAGKPEPAARWRPARAPWLLLLLAVAAVGAAVFVLTRPPKTAPTRSEASRPTSADVLVGTWQRADGDYALDVRRVHSDGRAEVAYFNPGPINVSRAEVKQEGGRLTLFVELRDVNYPGATYMLAYQPAQDALVGSYHQPALGQTYDVGFLRAK